MRATAWNGGQPNEPGSYGLKVTTAERDANFDRSWDEVVIDLDGAGSTTVTLTDSFWRRCTELRSADIGRWLLASGRAPWTTGQPPRIALRQVEGNHFAARILRQHNLL